MSPPASKWPLLTDWFFRYTRSYLRRSFHAIRLLGEPPAFAENERTPLVVCMNHSSWWDLLVSFFLERELFGWDCYGVMDARQLQRYRIFAHMGMLGVDRTSLAGAREFLHDCEMMLKGRRRALWLTPQGAMVSNYHRPIAFQPGIGHLAARLETFFIVEISLHYEFWDERLPEAFISISTPRLLRISPSSFDPRVFVRDAEQRMQAQLDALLTCVRRRDPACFRTLLSGRSGASPTYDLFREIGARLRGEHFSPEHGDALTPPWSKPK